MQALQPAKYLARMAAVLCAALLAVWIYVIAFPMAFLEGGYPAWIAKLTMLDQCRLGNISFFGNSRVEAGVVPALLPVEASNFGVAAGTPIEVHGAVQRALQCARPPSYAVISLAAGDFGPLSKYFWLNSIRYGFIDGRRLREVEETAERVDDTVSLRQAQTPEGMSGPVRDWLYAVRFPSLYFGSLLQGQVFRRYDRNREQLARVLDDRGFVAYARGPGAPQGPPVPGPKGVARTPLQTAYFERTLQLLLDRRIAVGLLFTPVEHSAGEPAAATAETAYLEYLRSLTVRFPNLQLINTGIPRWPAAMFVDGVHLEAEGARMLTRRLAACVEGEIIRAGCDLRWGTEDGSVSAVAEHARAAAEAVINEQPATSIGQQI